MKIQHVCIGAATRLPGRSMKTGIFKHPVGGSVIIDTLGLAGDAIINRKHHGGPDQAIYMEGSITLDWWARELGQAYEPGTFGENLILSDLDNRDVAAGDRFYASDVVLEATSPRTPCATFTARMNDPGFARRYTRAARPGIYCRVIAGGLISAGEPVRFEPFAGPRVTMAEILLSGGKGLTPEDRERYLAAPIHYKLRDKLAPAA